jgi:hypothetical protein
MTKTNLYQALQSAVMDDYAGIKIVKFTGDVNTIGYTTANWHTQ